MTLERISLGFVPLVDAAPLLVAEELGFAAEEGLAFDFHRFRSWAALRDAVGAGRVTAAQMLSPMPVASALGLGSAGPALEALSVLSLNGTVIGVSPALAARIGPLPPADAARATGERLLAAIDRPLRVGVPFPFSMQADLVHHWLGALGLSDFDALRVHTVPPPQMAEVLAAGEIDAFCVGEPWGTRAVRDGIARLLLAGAAIWGAAPEKVLAARAGWAADAPQTSAALIRAVWKAGRWLDAPGGRSLAADLIARAPYLDTQPETVEPGLTGRLPRGPGVPDAQVEQFLVFSAGCANFPWRSQAGWIADRLARRMGLDPAEARRRAEPTFRSDLFRAALAPLGVPLPAASARIEGALVEDREVPATRGSLRLRRDAFFDGSRFDPDFS